ncbi:cadherin-like protein 26 [Cyprinodon tularosa]|uniref:cadherin-like protein 26 n=1 Tax=Cyprinodon tularosa TaxID=77115 RepID=UPI0018E1E53C|nr:cadherin-like protein 26 [Cyprinodon tularosa]
MKSLPLLLLITLAALGLSEVGSKPHRRAKREFLSRSKRRWVLSTIELEEEMDVKYPYRISKMYNDKHNDDHHIFVMGGDGADETLFNIDEKTGDVYVLQPIDRETTPSFHITFDVKEEGTTNSIDRQLAFDVEVQDINDNPPKFIKIDKIAKVFENATSGEFLPAAMEVKDFDKEGTENSTFTVNVVDQIPAEPKIRVDNTTKNDWRLKLDGCFDYDKAKQYKIVLKAVDKGKPPLSSTATIILNIIDTNSHPPKFKKREYDAEALENTASAEILRVGVEDKDSPGTEGWTAKYFFISGNEDNTYNITTDTETNEGIIGIAKGKNFDITTFVNLEIGVRNIEDLTLCKDGKQSTPPKDQPLDSVKIKVKMVDTNDPPVFETKSDKVHMVEESEPGQLLYTPVVKDIDSSSFRYIKVNDSADWVTVDEKTGQITSVSRMDRESPHVVDNAYKVVIAAVDNGEPPATSTCTVTIYLRDINDNLPTLVKKTATLCTNEPEAMVKVPVKDTDADPYSGPFNFALEGDDTIKNWKLISQNGNEVTLSKRTDLQYGNYSVPLLMEDKQNQASKETLQVEVCECNEEGVCRELKPLLTNLGAAAIGLVIAGLLLFLLLLAVLTCNQKREFKMDIDDGHQTLINYNQEGGGTDCKSPIILPQARDVNEGLKQYMQETETSPEDLYRMDPMVASSSYGMNTMESQFHGGFHGNLKGESRRYASTIGRSTFRSNSTYSQSMRNSSFSQSTRATEAHLRSQLHRRLGAYERESSLSTDSVNFYEYEGSNKSCLSQENDLYEDFDLTFLEKLGPQFSTLAKICTPKSEVNNA